MQIPISSELEDLAKQYPLSYREVYALSIGVEKDKLEKDCGHCHSPFLLVDG